MSEQIGTDAQVDRPNSGQAGPSGQSAQTVALITGASSGIGRELARLLAPECRHLLLVARNEQRLNELSAELERTQHPPTVTVLPMDLSQRDAPERLAEDLKRADLQVDTLINNAGFGLCGNFWELPAVEQEQLITVNIQALVSLTRLFLPGMIQQGRGAILNIGSLAGFQPGPGMAVYFASKAFVNSFTEALAEELRPNPNIHVSCLCPGPTATEFGTRSGMGNSLIFKLGTQSAREVAEQGLQALRANQALRICGFKNWMLANSGRFAPRFMTRRIAGLLNRSS